MLELVDAGELAPKTVNNARVHLSSAFKEAARRGPRRGLMARNPCEAVRQLPADQIELEYLRLHEIGLYLAACSAHYRPLAEFLIGTGTRVSEAIAVRWRDLDLDRHLVQIHRQRGRTAAAWLAAGNPLIFVQRQLGHRSITTTETYYGHLEASFVRDAAAITEAAIQRATDNRLQLQRRRLRTGHTSGLGRRHRAGRER
jgi:integrase